MPRWSATTTPTTPRREHRRRASPFYARIGRLGMTPLWEVLGALVPPQPTSPVAAGDLALRRGPRARDGGGPAHHRRGSRAARAGAREPGAARPVVHHAVALRRAAARSCPARWRRRIATRRSALRLVLDGEGAYTAVDGERTTMRFGDFIITPSWTFHDHGNDGARAGRLARRPRHSAGPFPRRRLRREERREVAGRLRGPKATRWPATATTCCRSTTSRRPAEPSKVFVYPFAKTRESLLGISRSAIDRTTASSCASSTPPPASSPMPTMGTFAQRLPQGLRDPALSQQRRERAGLPRRRRHARRSAAEGCSSSARATCSWCRRGTPSACRRATTPTSSASPTGRCSRCSACGAKSASA